jgi:hypothetical protein
LIWQPNKFFSDNALFTQLPDILIAVSQRLENLFRVSPQIGGGVPHPLRGSRQFHRNAVLLFGHLVWFNSINPAHQNLFRWNL